MKNWIKENWMSVTGVVIVILVILFIVNRARKAKGESEIKPLKLPKITRTSTAPAPAQEGKSLEQLKKELADCEEKMKSVRAIAGSTQPCANLRDMVAKASGESNFNGTGAFAKTNELNVFDFGMGLDGMSLLEDKNLKSSMESNFRGAGLNSLNSGLKFIIDIGT